MRPALTILLVIPFLLCCCSGPRTRKTLSIPQTPGELLTGCYYIVDDSTGVKKSMVENGVPSSYYLDPRPVVTAEDYEEAEISDSDGLPVLTVRLNPRGAAAFAAASKRYQGKRLGFVIANQLVLAPVIYGEINGGAFQISGNLTDNELQVLLARIHHDMYEP